MKRITDTGLFFLMVSALFLLITPAARPDELPLWDNESVMTRFIAQYYQADPIVVISLGQRMRFPDDVSVALFLAKEAEANPMNLLDMRLKSKSWLNIAETLTIDPVSIFTPLSAKDKIPEAFRHAYSEFNKHQKDPNYPMVLYDKEFRNLVQLKLVVTAFNKSPRSVMDRVDQGESFTSIILEELPPQETKKEGEE